MKKYKLLRFLLIIFSICLLLSCISCKKKGSATSTVEKVDFSTLVDFIVEVEDGRDIRVLQLTDIQIVDGSQERYESVSSDEWIGEGGHGVRYRNYLRQVITRYNPDLILMTGDNVYGQFDDSGESLLGLISFMDSFKIPWAPIMGNHDGETFKGVDWQCAQYENSQYCLFKQRTLSGNGNYSVGVVQGGKLKRVFYMLDSNGSGNLSDASFNNGHTPRNFQGFTENQIEWYTSSINTLKSKCSGVKLSFCFHIPFKAFKDASDTYDLSNGAIDLDKVGREGDFGVLSGSYGAWDEDYVVWNSFKTLGVDSVFVGHEHSNSSSIMHEGIRLTYGQKSSTYDSHNYYNSQTGEIKHIFDGENEPMVGGTCIDLSKADGGIVNSYVMLYDKNYALEDEETDLQAQKATVTDISQEKGEFKGVEFNRYALSDLGFENPTLEKSFSKQINAKAYSVKMRIRTLGDGFEKGRLRISFFTQEGQVGDYSVIIKANYVVVGLQNIPYSFEQNTEYEIEVGAIMLYGDCAVYTYVKINGEVADRWALQEIVEIKGDYLHVVQNGSNDFCELVA